MHVDLMRDAAIAFPVLEFPNNVKSLRVWHCKYKGIKPVASLQNIEELVIASFPEDSFDFLGALVKLRYLSVLHMPKVKEISALGYMKNLEVLSLATSPAWDAAGKLTVVDSLGPISKLSALRHLELFGVCPVGSSLADLERCKSLRTARFSKYPKDEVERFYRVSNVANEFNPKPSFEM